jgi:ABC-2 type transport system ATP-binding protein
VTDLAITAEGLVKSFGTVHALAGVSFAVPRGTVLGLLGPNGAGKTTAVRILTTLLQPDAGRATVNGIDVTVDPKAIRRMIGLAGQYAAVDENLTGDENLRLMGRLTHLEPSTISARSRELLDEFNLTDAASRPTRTYSGGMRRRLDLAAALVHRPPVLFLDEPTTGLDPRSRTDLWQVIANLVSGGTTVLLTTQYLEEADRLADNIVVIDGGKVIAEGTASELKNQMGATVIEVTVPAVDVARTAEVLGSLGPVSIDANLISMKVNDGAALMVQVVRQLDAANVRPTGLVLREPTLDDVFLSLTGHTTEVSA